MMKWLMSMVFPGVDEVQASPLRAVSMLIRLLLPTLLLPIKAYSGLSPAGQWVTELLLIENSADFICMLLGFDVWKRQRGNLAFFLTVDGKVKPNALTLRVKSIKKNQKDGQSIRLNAAGTGCAGTLAPSGRGQKDGAAFCPFSAENGTGGCEGLLR